MYLWTVSRHLILEVIRIWTPNPDWFRLGSPNAVVGYYEI